MFQAIPMLSGALAGPDDVGDAVEQSENAGVLLDSVPSRRVLADLAHPWSPSTSLMPM